MQETLLVNTHLLHSLQNTDTSITDRVSVMFKEPTLQVPFSSIYFHRLTFLSVKTTHQMQNSFYCREASATYMHHLFYYIQSLHMN